MPLTVHDSVVCIVWYCLRDKVVFPIYDTYLTLWPKPQVPRARYVLYMCLVVDFDINMYLCRYATLFHLILFNMISDNRTLSNIILYHSCIIRSETASFKPLEV